MLASEAAVLPGGYSGPLGHWERVGETGRRFVPNILYIHWLLNGLEPISPFHQGGEDFGDGYPGGDYNPIAQLAPCLKLIVPGFGELQKAPRTLLKNTFGEGAFNAYRTFTDYQKAVFVNTAVAAGHVGANFSSAKFLNFYRADYGYENGIYVDGLQGKTSGRHRERGSVEFEREKKGKYKGKIHIDVDLYHPLSLSMVIPGLAHALEVNFNKKHKRGTHPGDVALQLAKEGIRTGVSCKRK